MATLEESKAKFLRAYGNLPVPERSQVVVIVDNEPYSWNVAHNEIIHDTVLGKKILEEIKALGIL